MKLIEEMVVVRSQEASNTRDTGKGVVFSPADKTEKKALGSIAMPVISSMRTREKKFYVRENPSMEMFIGQIGLTFLTMIW